VDFEREGYARAKRIRRAAYSLLSILGATALAWFLVSREPAVPSVDRESLWIGKVEKGPLVIQVRGPGTLVPEEIRWIAAATDGRVERIPILPGSAVTASTVLARLDNPTLEQEAMDAELQFKKGVAELESLKMELENQVLSQQSLAASVQAEFEQKRLETERYEALAKVGLVSDLELKVLQITTSGLEKRHGLEQSRLAATESSRRARVAAKEAELEQTRSLFQLRRKQVASLMVRAGIDGVLQETPVEVGQQVRAGDILGKVAVPGRLKAELRVPETQARDVRAGLSAAIDTRNGVVSGRVVRIDPAARDGAVTVDVAIGGELPRGARPDQFVDGAIEIERLEDVLHMGRPVFAQTERTVGLFKLLDGGKEAVRVPVRLGRSSVTSIQVLEGLQEGDSVILSDTSSLAESVRIRLE
jgi:HlyD family secretion protein